MGRRDVADDQGHDPGPYQPPGLPFAGGVLQDAQQHRAAAGDVAGQHSVQARAVVVEQRVLGGGPQPGDAGEVGAEPGDVADRPGRLGRVEQCPAGGVRVVGAQQPGGVRQQLMGVGDHAVAQLQYSAHEFGAAAHGVVDGQRTGPVQQGQGPVRASGRPGVFCRGGQPGRAHAGVLGPAGPVTGELGGPPQGVGQFGVGVLVAGRGVGGGGGQCVGEFRVGALLRQGGRGAVAQGEQPVRRPRLRAPVAPALPGAGPLQGAGEQPVGGAPPLRRLAPVGGAAQQRVREAQPVALAPQDAAARGRIGPERAESGQVRGACQDGAVRRAAQLVRGGGQQQQGAGPFGQAKPVRRRPRAAAARWRGAGGAAVRRR
ncbi:hypothetical protein LUW77_09735 [Streptomyces radiopugnans]|nr:hypothetical protein LUW77_09735 [Streptomyces radiopugnans]